MLLFLEIIYIKFMFRTTTLLNGFISQTDNFKTEK